MSYESEVLRRHLPDAALEVVEIDPVVVKVAAEYFGVRDGVEAAYGVRLMPEPVLVGVEL